MTPRRQSTPGVDNSAKRQPYTKACSTYLARGRGRATQTIRHVHAGERILEEAPLLQVKALPSDVLSDDRWLVPRGQGNGRDTIAYHIAQLTPTARKHFRKLHGHFPPGRTDYDDTYAGYRDLDLRRLAMNCFTQKLIPEGENYEHSIVRVYKNISRINHSCRPNAIYFWDSDEQKATIYALVPIDQGTEITIDYRSDPEANFVPTAVRCQNLFDIFEFTCTCAACGDEPLAGKLDYDDPDDPPEQHIVTRSRQRQEDPEHEIDHKRRLRARRAYDEIDFDDIHEAIEDENQVDEIERRRTAQMNHLDEYIMLLRELGLTDIKLAQAFEARAKLWQLRVLTAEIQQRGQAPAPTGDDRNPGYCWRQAENAWEACWRIHVKCAGETHPELERVTSAMLSAKARVLAESAKEEPVPSNLEKNGGVLLLIHLTRADLAGLDDRLEARRLARLPKPKASNVRLSPGPGHPARLSFVSAEQNAARQQARCSPPEDEHFDGVGGQPMRGVVSSQAGNNSSPWTATTPSDIHGRPSDQSALCQQAVRALDGVVEQMHSPKRPSPRRQVDSFFSEEQREIREIEREIAEHSPPTQLDGVAASDIGSLPQTPFVHRDNDSHLPPRTEPRPFSSARARRRHARSSEEPALFREGIRPFSTQSQTWLNPVHQLVLSTETSEASLNPALDPGAPVFVPRTRFGTSATSSTDSNSPAIFERPWRSLDHTSSLSNLRLQSPSGQNLELPFGQRNGPAHHGQHGQLPTRQRQRSRTSDQNTAFPRPSPNLERYPLLHPTINPISERHMGGVQRLATRSSSVTLHTSFASQSHQPQNYHVRHADTSSNELLAVGGPPVLTLRSTSPAFSTSSRSTPNLLQAPTTTRVHSRGSSLSWSRSGHATPVLRPGSVVSAHGGLSSSPQPAASRQSSREGLDAAAEFLRMRNSPLDDLTERLSRLAAGRQRSVGRSWERYPDRRGRVSLLTGDPFRQESEMEARAYSSPLVLSTPTEPTDTIDQENVPELAGIEEDLVALSLALPPSSRLSSGSKLPPSTSPLPNMSSPRSPLAQRSPAKSIRSPPPSIKRKPVPSAAHATPRVKVYDETRPSCDQPQTPADLARSTRRTRNRSDITVQQTPVAVDRSIISSPPPIPERSPFRHTYPPAPTLDAAARAAEVSTAATAHAAAVEVADRHQRRVQAQRSSENDVENAVEGSLQDLEQDRRIWIGRREEGTLDVTPPREGRYEQYLS